jgi:2-polyprenyl-3-methyl-5-hydroxy-6-metoxy-1,4-benzoquinol methylase
MNMNMNMYMNMNMNQQPQARMIAHYDSHLSSVYDWMAGGWDAAMARNQQILQELVPVASVTHKSIAVDLGAGSGYQSIPLMNMGYNVVAIDLSQDLLDILRKHIDTQENDTTSVTTFCDDIITFDRHLPKDNSTGETIQVEVIVCMGDTLTHLSDLEQVRTMFALAFSCLSPSTGCLLLSFRNYMHELQGCKRFIPVRSDSSRVFTCFLEYKDDMHIDVHDLLHSRVDNNLGGSSDWNFSASSYTKLRLNPTLVCKDLEAVGFRIETFRETNGFVIILARRS